MSAALESLAAQFGVEPLPADQWQQMELLQMYEVQARQVVEALPEPYVLSKRTVKDMDDMTSDMQDLASQMEASLASPAITVPAEIVRSFVIGSYVTAAYQASIFTPELRAALVASGKISADALDADMWRRINVMKAIATVGNSSLLVPLYKQASAVQGVGLAPVVIGGVKIAGEIVIAAAVIAVAAIAALAWVAVNVYLIADTNRTAADIIDRTCFDENGKPYPQTAEACLKAALDMQNHAADEVAKGGPSSIVDKVLLYGAIGIGIYATIVFLPDIVKSVRSAKQAARE